VLVRLPPLEAPVGEGLIDVEGRPQDNALHDPFGVRRSTSNAELPSRQPLEQSAHKNCTLRVEETTVPALAPTVRPYPPSGDSPPIHPAPPRHGKQLTPRKPRTFPTTLPLANPRTGGGPYRPQCRHMDKRGKIPQANRAWTKRDIRPAVGRLADACPDGSWPCVGDSVVGKEPFVAGIRPGQQRCLRGRASEVPVWPRVVQSGMTSRRTRSPVSAPALRPPRPPAGSGWRESQRRTMFRPLADRPSNLGTGP
jgi:hypothetical protein